MTQRVDPVLFGYLPRRPGAEGKDLGTELLGRFTETLITLLPRLRALAAAGDAATLALDSHSLRGSASLLGAIAMADLAKTLETHARGCELERAPELIDALAAEWTVTFPEHQAACVAAATAAAAAAAAAAMRTRRFTPASSRPAD